MSLPPKVFLHYSFVTFQPYTIICNDIICFSAARLTKRHVHYFVSLFLSIIMDLRRKACIAIILALGTKQHVERRRWMKDWLQKPDKSPQVVLLK
jgi:hypothetical protein